jgi:5-methylcytosine-specific restriction protein A
VSPQKRPKPCTRCGQPAAAGQSQCERHLAQARARTDQKRGTAAQRGYNRQHDQVFRAGVFALYGDRCVMPSPFGYGHCARPATHADHYPKSRRELEAAGDDPNDPRHGRPLCEHHHNSHTGRTQGPLAKQRRRE